MITVSFQINWADFGKNLGQTPKKQGREVGNWKQGAGLNIQHPTFNHQVLEFRIYSHPPSLIQLIKPKINERYNQKLGTAPEECLLIWGQTTKKVR